MHFAVLASSVSRNDPLVKNRWLTERSKMKISVTVVRRWNGSLVLYANLSWRNEGKKNPWQQ